MDKIRDLVNGILPKVLPFRMINHQINLIDLNKQIHYQLPKCPDTLTAVSKTWGTEQKFPS